MMRFVKSEAMDCVSGTEHHEEKVQSVYTKQSFRSNIDVSLSLLNSLFGLMGNFVCKVFTLTVCFYSLRYLLCFDAYVILLMKLPE